MKTKYILIAGHYDLLDQPTPFALNSMKSVIDIQKEYGMEYVELYCFVNDMRYENFCNSGLCNLQHRKEGGQEFSEVFFTTKESSKSFAEELRNRLLSEGLLGFSRYFVSHYDQIIDKRDVTSASIIDLKNSCLNLMDDYNAHNEYMVSQNYDRLMYMFNKDVFVPLAFEKLLDGKSCRTLYEKNVFNSVSKIIKKMYQKKDENLFVHEEDGKTFYECNGFDGKKIFLRMDSFVDTFKAINKCPAIIGMLYFKILQRSMKVFGVASKYSIMYIVPSYDRTKIDLGTQAFYNLFLPYLLKECRGYFPEIEIKNVYWGDEKDSFSITDTYNSHCCIHRIFQNLYDNK